MKSTQNNFTLRRLLVVSFILISAIPVLLLAYWVQHTALEKEFEAVYEKHLIIAKNLTAAIERYIDDAQSAFRIVVSEDKNRGINSLGINKLLEKLHFQKIWLYKEDKLQPLFGDYKDKLEGNVMPDEVLEFVRTNKKSAKTVNEKILISGVMNNVDNTPIIVMMLNVGHESYAIATLSPEYIIEVQSAIEFGERGHAVIVDQHGHVMAHPVKKWHETMKDISFLPAVKNTVAGKTGVTEFYTPAMQVDMIAGHTVVKNTGWGVMISQPVMELIEKAKYAQYMALFITIFGVIIAALISWWLASYLTRSFNNMTKFTESVASGELSSHIELEKGIIPQELSILVSSFNRMIDKLKNKTEDFVTLNDRLREAQNIAKLGNWKLNITDNNMWWSDEVYRILGLHKSEIAAPTLDVMLSVMDESQSEKFLNSLKKAILTKTDFSIDCKKQNQDNEAIYFHQDVVVQVNTTNEILCLSGTIQDVTERKIQEEILHFQAHYDSLTKLPNRDNCLEVLEKSLVDARNKDRILPFFLVGLDHFKEVNGSLGHNVGDKLLQLASERIYEIIDENDFIARLGSDEFAIILNSVTEMENVHVLANRVIDEFQKPFTVDYYEATVGASIGISVYPEFDAFNPLLMLQKADTALHSAKANGRGTYCLFNSEMDEQVISRMNLRSEISTALENKEFHLVFQPIVDSKTGKVICAESLIRWVHPTRGNILPDKFISLAEETGHIAEIGFWVIDEACKELKKWHTNGFPDLYISVNLSLRQIQLGLKKEDIMGILKKYQLEPSFLTLEITESLLMEDLDDNLVWLNDVRTTGVRFSIDDFGTGYSSLSYLLNLPVSTLKIDRAFVSNILFGNKDETLIEMIITLSKKLGFKVVAEGVETQGQLDKLNDYDCDLIQGYFFSKPMVSHEFMEYIKNDKIADNVTNLPIRKV